MTKTAREELEELEAQRAALEARAEKEAEREKQELVAKAVAAGIDPDVIQHAMAEDNPTLPETLEQKINEATASEQEPAPIIENEEQAIDQVEKLAKDVGKAANELKAQAAEPASGAVVKPVLPEGATPSSSG